MRIIASASRALHLSCIKLALTITALLVCGPTPVRAAVGDIYIGEDNGSIERFLPDGTESTFASGLAPINALAFDRSGNLFAACGGGGVVTIYKFEPNGNRTTFASGFGLPFTALACDSAGNLFAAGQYDDSFTYRTILKFSPDGSYGLYDTGYHRTLGLAVDANDNLFATGALPLAYKVFKYAPDGTRTLFGVANLPGSLATDSLSDVFMSTGSGIVKFTPDGTRSTFVSTIGVLFNGLACNASDTLFALDSSNEILAFSPDGTQSTFVSGLNAPPTAIAIQVPEPSGLSLFLAAIAALWLISPPKSLRVLRVFRG